MFLIDQMSQTCVNTQFLKISLNQNMKLIIEYK
jgi:hypothetical protein